LLLDLGIRDVSRSDTSSALFRTGFRNLSLGRILKIEDEEGNLEGAGYLGRGKPISSVL
jgi:hypothetical protein